MEIEYIKVTLKVPEGEKMYSFTVPSTSALDGVGGGVNATSRPPYSRERPGAHCIGSWVDPRAGLDGCGKSRSPPGFDPQTVQPVACRYTDRAIPVYTRTSYGHLFTFLQHISVVPF